MKNYSRSIIATGIALALVACNDDSSVSGKDNSEPSNITVQIGDAQVKGLNEHIGITNLDNQAETVGIEAFKGIRYATANRFEHSQLVEPAQGVIDATAFGDICPQAGREGTPQSEDCLSLNIWRPAGTSEQDALPVYVFIHGGSFESGAGSNALNQSDTVVAQSISDTYAGEREEPFIAVSLNYRVGLLGSMWVDNPQGGNFGIGDQKRALEWVNKNIQYFGGNSDNVTVFGESAGAMSIGILQQDPVVAGGEDLNDPEHNGYYQRAIMQSNPYGIAYKSYDSAEEIKKDVVAAAGGQDIHEISLDKLMDIQTEIKGKTVKYLLESKPTTSGFLPFAPYIEQKKNRFGKVVIEGNHLKSQPMTTKYNVPTVVGFNTDESNIFTSMFEVLLYANIKNKDGDYVIGDEIILDNGQDVREAIESDFIGGIYGLMVRAFFGGIPKDVIPGLPGNCDGLWCLVADGSKLLGIEAYKASPGNSIEMSSENVRKTRMLANDMLFTCPTRKALQAQQGGEHNVVMYQFEHESQFNFWPFSASPLAALSCQNLDGTVKGKACHAAELPYVFSKAMNIKGEKVLTNAADKKLMAHMSRKWFSDSLFSNDVSWDKSSDNNDKFIKINANGFELNNYWDQSYNASRCAELEDKGLLNF